MNLFEQIRMTHSDNFLPRQPAVPTQTRPGTPERMAVLLARIEAGEALWHPDDLTCRPTRYESVLTRTDDPPCEVRFAGHQAEVMELPFNED